MLVQAKKAGEMGDADFLRLAAEEAELQRAKERLTLKHRNTSQWARRALRRGINVMDEGRALLSALRVTQSWTAASWYSLKAILKLPHEYSACISTSQQP